MSHCCWPSPQIAEDFSNYSAWHYRSILLPRIHGSDCKTDPNTPTGDAASAQPTPTYTGMLPGSASQKAPVPVEVLDEEYDMVHQAFATDSKDQSPWMYYRQVLEQEWASGWALQHVPLWLGLTLGIRLRDVDVVHVWCDLLCRWLVGNSLAHLEVARGTAEEEVAREILRAVSLSKGPARCLMYC